MQGWPTWPTPPPTNTEGSSITDSRSNYSQSSFAGPSSAHARSGLRHEAGEVEMTKMGKNVEEVAWEKGRNRTTPGYELHRC